jgi:SAM-dependent methyltransferase
MENSNGNSAILEKYPFLGCPHCHHALRPADAGLLCESCGRSFPSVGEVPILFPEQVTFSQTAATSHQQSARGVARRVLTYGRHLGNNHQRLVDLCAGGHILSVGGGPQRDRPEYINFNLAPMPGVDIVGDAAQLPCQDQSVTGVVCNAVLEHVRDPWKVVHEIHRVLKPGGFVYIEVPFLQHYHPSPEDFWRFTIQGTRELCRDFTQIDSGLCGGPMSTVVELVESYLMLPLENLQIRNLVKGTVRLFLYPLRIVEPFVMLSSKVHTVANGFYFVGQKQPSPSPAPIDKRANE